MKMIKSLFFIAVLLLLVLFGGCKKEVDIPEDSSMNSQTISSDKSVQADLSETSAPDEISLTDETVPETVSSEPPVSEAVTSVPAVSSVPSTIPESSSERIESTIHCTFSTPEETPSRDTESYISVKFEIKGNREEFEEAIKKENGSSFVQDWYYRSADNTMASEWFTARVYSTRVPSKGTAEILIGAEAEYITEDGKSIKITYPWTTEEKYSTYMIRLLKQPLETRYKTVVYDGIEYIVITDPESIEFVDDIKFNDGYLDHPVVFWKQDGMYLRADFKDGFSEDMIKYLKLEKVDLEK